MTKRSLPAAFIISTGFRQNDGRLFQGALPRAPAQTVGSCVAYVAVFFGDCAGFDGSGRVYSRGEKSPKGIGDTVGGGMCIHVRISSPWWCDLMVARHTTGQTVTN